MQQWETWELSRLFSEYDDSLERKFGFPEVANRIASDTFSKETRTVLEIGCGSGALTSCIVADDTFVIACDISCHSLTLARDRFSSKQAVFVKPEMVEKLDEKTAIAVACSAFLYCTIRSRCDIVELFEFAARLLPSGSSYYLLDFNSESTGVDFGTFRAGERDHDYTNGDALPVTMKTINNETFMFEDTYWHPDAIVKFATSTGKFALNHSTFLGPLVDGRRPFVLLSLTRSDTSNDIK